MKTKTRHFPITDFGGRGGLNVPFNLSKIVAKELRKTTTWAKILKPFLLKNVPAPFNNLLIKDMYNDVQRVRVAQIQRLRHHQLVQMAPSILWRSTFSRRIVFSPEQIS